MDEVFHHLYSRVLRAVASVEPLCVRRRGPRRGDSADRISGRLHFIHGGFVNCGCDVHIHHGPAACWVSGWGCIRSTDSDSRKKGGWGQDSGVGVDVLGCGLVEDKEISVGF